MNLRRLLAATAAFAATLALAAPATASPGPKPKINHAAVIKPALTGGPAGVIHVMTSFCLDDASNGTTTGTPVDIYTCNGTPAQSWTMVSDGTVRVHGTAGQCLGIDASGSALEPCTDPSAQWVSGADKTLISMTSADPTHLICLNDPRASTTKGTQLIPFKCVYPVSNFLNEVFATPGTTYASSALSYRPDSGGNGNWSLDTMTRQASVTPTGGTNYAGDIIDDGTFVTMPGNFTPNQGIDSGKTLGDAFTGTMHGAGGFVFTSDKAVTTTPPKAVQGVGTLSTSNWMSAFFASGATIGGPGLDNTGPLRWSWEYVTNGPCVQTWTDASPGGGQSAADSGITAPAPGGTC